VPISGYGRDVALATDLDKDTSDEDRVALMTIHLAKGWRFHMFSVGMEEDLFFSAGMNSEVD
jgi:DNA helicase-2/ATP-dependent DNA helicase PcrA